ncbi:hypothetical protein [Neisseria canis]|nr:hypothetical protein [Neisseria canis]
MRPLVASLRERPCFPENPAPFGGSAALVGKLPPPECQPASPFRLIG